MTKRQTTITQCDGCGLDNNPQKQQRVEFQEHNRFTMCGDTLDFCNQCAGQIVEAIREVRLKLKGK